MMSGLIEPWLCLELWGGGRACMLELLGPPPGLLGGGGGLPVVVRMLAVNSRAEGRSQLLASEPLPRLETPWACALRTAPSSSSRASGGKQALCSAWKLASSAWSWAWKWRAGGPSRA